MGLFKRFVGNDKEEAAAPEAKQAAVEPRHLTDAKFAQLIQGDQPVVVDFWAEWCTPCHAIAPFVAKLADEYAGRLVVGKVNADDYPDILTRLQIMGIPTLIFFKGGREVDRVIGYQPYGSLKARFERFAA